MKLYKHLALSHANKIIELANKGMSQFKIHKETGTSRGKIRRCLDSCRIETRKQNLSQPWKGPHIKVRYSKKLYYNLKIERKMEREYKMSIQAQPIYKVFIDFCESLYKKKIVRRSIKRSADEFLKEFKKIHPFEPTPDRTWVYKMAKSPYYDFNSKWLPSAKGFRGIKSKDERAKPVKFNDIDDRPDKEYLRSFPGNFEIDSVIGKREDKQALLTLIDIHTGNFYSALYNRTMHDFANVFAEIIKNNVLEINTLTMDNGGENNMLGTILPFHKLFNCKPYNSGQKGTLENKHRIVRRVIPKGISLDNYGPTDILELNTFVNNYYSKTFNRI